MNDFRYKLQRFMIGRYGVDSLNRFLMGAAFVTLLISMAVRPLYYLAIALLVFSYFRMFSRNIAVRTKENQWYWQHSAKLRAWWQKRQAWIAQTRAYHIYRCPNCRQKIRVPRGRGKIEIRCRKCNETFIRRS